MTADRGGGEGERLTDAQHPRDDLVVVGRAQNQSEAELLQQLLRAEGIPSLLRRAPGFDVPDLLAAGPREILVPARAETDARDALYPTERTGRDH